MKTVLLAVLCATAWASAVSPSDWYVSPTGDDASDGKAPGRAFRTIGKAVSVLKAGDTVHLAPGQYAERVTISVSGASDAPITIRGSADGRTVWTMPLPDPVRWEEKFALWVKESRFIVVEGITFRDCCAWILLDRSHFCAVKDCTFDGARIYNCCRVNSGSHNRFLNCDFVRAVRRTGVRQDMEWAPEPGADYIEIFRDSHANLVERCRFGEINHVAVSISAVDKTKFLPGSNIVRACVFTDPFWKCVWIGAGTRTLIEDNTFSGTSACFLQLEGSSSVIRYNIFRDYRDSTGGKPDPTFRGAIRIQYNEAIHNRIFHNLFIDNERAITNSSFRWEVYDNIFQNNIFFRNGQTVFLGFPEYRTKNRNFFFGNLMAGTGPEQKVIRLERDEYTLAEAQEQLPELCRCNIGGDPRLVRDAQGRYTGLSDSSPCIDRGVPLTVTATAGKGRRLPVKDAWFFFDGAAMIPGDRISVGGDRTAQVLRVDAEAGILDLDADVSWSEGEPVTLARSSAGRAPDIGPFEYVPAKRE